MLSVGKLLSSIGIFCVLLSACTSNTDTASKTTARFHVDGWAAPDLHGMGAKFQEFECISCHGDDLTGGSVGVSCDSCHDDGWRNNCTFCHGGTEDSTGAPPVNLDGQSTGLPFTEHHAHLQAQNHPEWSCNQCHNTPTDILTPGHIFVEDDSVGMAEVNFSAGLSVVGDYSAGSCSNLYCHGNGAGVNGSVHSGETLACDGCHGDARAPEVLSGMHANHIENGANCSECHISTVSDNETVSDPNHHVNGTVDVAFVSDMVVQDGVCSGTCHDVYHDGSSWTNGTFHPSSWEAPDQHGLSAKLQSQNCSSCHGEDLRGGRVGVSCDGCHEVGWRSDCTYCHGGTDNTTGAPPEDIDDSTTLLSFAEHTTHVTLGDHAAWGCEQCHTTPTDVLSEGHLFTGDSTPALAELNFMASLSGDGVYEGNGSCSNLYCHGNGVTNGSAITGLVTDCGSCHGTISAPDTLSTVHANHLLNGASCEECHNTTVLDSQTILDPMQHVDGEKDVSLVAGISYDGNSCTGNCHGAYHDTSTWTVGGFHPTGWEAPDQHGLSAKLQSQDCTSCHGTDLTGGLSGVSCDSCHQADWRSNCTYCHGGTDNTTGAPPEDIDGSSVSISFDEHSVHVETTANHAAWGCEQCHTTPTDVLSNGHIFIGDTTPAIAELDFSNGLSDLALYTGNASCSNLYCHGNGNGMLGTIATGTVTNCGSCHGTASNTLGMSGQHNRHLGRDVRAQCDECHASTAIDSSAILDPTLHVNGAVDTSFPSGMSFNGSSCSGTCHGEDHSRERW